MKGLLLFLPLISATPGEICVTSSLTPCVLPFRHKNKTYVGCTREHAMDGLAWCSTKVDSEGQHVTGESAWGECELSSCPRDVTCRTLRVKDLDGDFASGLFVFSESVHLTKPVYENTEKGLSVFWVGEAAGMAGDSHKKSLFFPDRQITRCLYFRV